ncbi:hypothetical protein [Rhizobium sp. Leaf453]|uniref:hypothetical protein n=1 Tax=Rhizobium sp. Leaf453 TaxID=1736380 RepID=UPI0007124B49|nr:hypothetical protein [Rhizobium sp. Leaf453]KQT92635.1 hypothetical protein ASG68_17735 [Rhizobium sp. Leaf453]
MTMHEDTSGVSDESLVETELRAALQRVKERIVKGRPAPISYSAVAREAGRSRTLIGHDACAYPNVRKAVTKAIQEQKGLHKPGNRLPTSVEAVGQSAGRKTTTVETEQNDSFHLVAHLKSRVAVLIKQNTVAAVKIVTIDDENHQLREEIARLKMELARRKASTRN